MKLKMVQLKMIPLKMHQQVWTWVGVCPVEDNSSMWKKFAIILFTFAVLVAHLSLIMASIMFIMQADYEGTLHAISLVTMIVATAYVLGSTLDISNNSFKNFSIF